MPLEETATQTEIFKSYIRRHSLKVYQANGEILRLSRGRIARDGFEYKNYISSISEMRQSIDAGIDRITIEAQNVNSELGFKVASDVRLLDYAHCDYGIERQSVRTPSLIDYNGQDFRGILANAEADETRVKFELVVDYEAFGAIIASRTLSPRSPWTTLNGIEVTAAPVVARPKTRADFLANGVEHEYGGWGYFEEAESDLPGGGGNTGGGTGGGEVVIPPNCFTLNTKILTPNSEIEIGDFPFGVPSEKIKVISFNETTGEIEEDEIIEVFESIAHGCFTLTFDHAVVKVTEKHRFFTAEDCWVTADKLSRGDFVRILTKNNNWLTSQLKAIRWNSDVSTKVRNLRVRKNHTFFANGCAVHNSKIGPDGGQIFV